MPRYFALTEAETLLPEIRESIREAVKLKGFLDDAEGELRSSAQRIMMLGGSNVDQQRILGLRGRRDALAGRLKEHIESIHEHGCLVKDLDLGLVDFPTLLRGAEVYLCWKLGEEGIGFWHGVDEGFRGRKQIDQDFLDNHRGGGAG